MTKSICIMVAISCATLVLMELGFFLNKRTSLFLRKLSNFPLFAYIAYIIGFVFLPFLWQNINFNESIPIFIFLSNLALLIIATGTIREMLETR